MRRALIALCVASLSAAACGAASGAPSASPASVPADAVRLAAERMTFDRDTLTVPAGRAFAIVFENRDQVPHNLAISDAAGSAVFEGEMFGGPATRFLQVAALPAGSYSFRCQLHPDMHGSLAAS